MNNKLPFKIKNKTNYFIPDRSKALITLSSPETYQSRQQKIEGYENRLYWQWRYCEEHNGQTFFYTLTYNDKALPKKYGQNCFDYEDLRDLLTGGFRKKLLRKYGTTFKYYVGAELGDGKGQRGLHNNPHYHILFFLEPANNEKYPYKWITEKEMTHLVKMYWQGFDENETGYQSYKNAKYGIADDDKDGLGAKVQNFKAVEYVAKYVCKDINLVRTEHKIVHKIRQKYSFYRNSEECYKDFFECVINPYFNTPGEGMTWTKTNEELVKELLPNETGLFIDVYQTIVPAIIRNENLEDEYENYVETYIQMKVKEAINEWRNRYCNKCRISQGVGDYAIPTIDKMDPTIQIPTKDGWKNRPINMYYYRKLYMDVVKDKVNGNNLYVLNEDGINFKCSKLQHQLDRRSKKIEQYIDQITNNEELFNKIRYSDCNQQMTYTYNNFMDWWNSHKYDIHNIIKRYALYKLVYEDRFFKVQSTGSGDGFDYPNIDPDTDYRKFLTPTYYDTNRNTNNLNRFLQSAGEDYLPYFSHPYFLRDYSIYNVFDTFTNYFYIQKDNKNQAEAEERKRINDFHKQMRMKKFFKQFS